MLLKKHSFIFVNTVTTILCCLFIPFALSGCATNKKTVNIAELNTQRVDNERFTIVLAQAPEQVHISLEDSPFGSPASAIVGEEYMSALGTPCRQATVIVDITEHFIAVCKKQNTSFEESPWQLVPSIKQ